MEGGGRGIRILSEPYASLGDASERDARKASEKESATPRIDRSIDRDRQRRVEGGREGFLSAGTKRFACASAIFGAGFGAASDCIPRTRRLKSIFLARSGRKKTRGTMHHAVHALSPREATTARDLIHPALCIKAAHCTARVHRSFPGLRIANTEILRSAARAFPTRCSEHAAYHGLHPLPLLRRAREKDRYERTIIPLINRNSTRRSAGGDESGVKREL